MHNLLSVWTVLAAEPQLSLNVWWRSKHQRGWDGRECRESAASGGAKTQNKGVVSEGRLWHAEAQWEIKSSVGCKDKQRPSLTPLSMPGTSRQLWPSRCHRNTDHYQNNRWQRGRERQQQMMENVPILINTRHMWCEIIQAWSEEGGGGGAGKFWKQSQAWRLMIATPTVCWCSV